MPSESFICDVQVLKRIAIPKTIYETLDIKDGDRVRVTIEKVS